MDKFSGLYSFRDRKKDVIKDEGFKGIDVIRVLTSLQRGSLQITLKFLKESEKNEYFENTIQNSEFELMFSDPA